MARLAIGAEEKKKLYVLGGLLAAITLVVVVLYVPHGGSKTPVEPPTPAGKTPPPGAIKNPPGSSSAPGIGPGAPEGAEGTPDAGTAGGGAGSNITAASLVSVSNFRDDPFRPFPLPPPVATPTPPPPPPGPVSIAPPDVILQPPFGTGLPTDALPPFGVGPGGSIPGSRIGSTPTSRILHDLPPVRITRVADTPLAPSAAVLPGGNEGGVSRSPNKRLSGVIIGDSVRALLEITNGDTVTTRIVQPGDEVDGIRILRIERVAEGGQTVTRLFIRENGEEHFVDLRPAPQAAAGAGGAAPGR